MTHQETTPTERTVTVKVEKIQRVFGSIIHALDDLGQIEDVLYCCERRFSESKVDYPKELFELMHSQIKSALSVLGRSSSSTFYMTCVDDLEEFKEGKSGE